ncbi:MAG TPA: fatty acid desaturase [Pyrinomonadaceae bacterium]|jgi:stearoyl-CoA desaturase (delta-9 desaturase)
MLNSPNPQAPAHPSKASLYAAAGVAAASAPFRSLEQRIALVVVIVPFLGFLAALALVWEYGVTWTQVGLLAVTYALGALGTEVGFHRLFSHRSFQAKPFVTALLAVLGSMNAQGPVLYWAAIHRRHHQFSDQEGDPHSPYVMAGGGRPGNVLRGLWYAHVGWLFVHEITDWGRYVPDLIKNKIVFKISRYYLVWPVVGLILPALAGALLIGGWRGALDGFLWGGLVRIFIAQQVTWGVNSIGHTYGRRPFPLDDRSTNNGWLALPSAGGSWHNNHHAFPSSAWHGLRWWQLDLAGCFIAALAAAGLAWKVERPTEEMITSKLGAGVAG